MRHGWRATLRRRAERILRPGGRAVILLYHRIAEDVSDPYGLCVAPTRFEEHLEAVRTVGRPMPLPALAQAVRERNVPDGAICITFDDGYVDNLSTARPLLARHDVPATVFMTTGRAGRDREFWWDELQRVLFEPPQLPAVLEIPIADRCLRLDFGADAMYAADDPRRSIRWHVLDKDAPSLRHAAFQQAYAAIKPLPPDERTRVIDHLLEWAGLRAAHIRESRRALEPAEVVELAREGLVHIGAHTVTHPALPSQTAEVQRDEVSRSRSQLEAWLGAQIQGFAYPYGLYDDRSVSAVREAGFSWACSCLPHAASARSDVLLLPRIEISDCDGDQVASLLRWELCGMPQRSRRPAAR